MRNLSPLNLTLLGVIAVLLALLIAQGRYDVMAGGPYGRWIFKHDRWIGTVEVCDLFGQHCHGAAPQ